MRRRQMVAAFDVDAPCLVATPFDSDMERLPRPEDRSMSVCWIVERIDREQEKDADEKEAARLLECKKSDDLYGTPDLEVDHENSYKTKTTETQHDIYKSGGTVQDDTRHRRYEELEKGQSIASLPSRTR